MAASKTPIHSLLHPLSHHQTQLHLGKGIHTLGLLRWVLCQTGAARVLLTTFSTSEEFLCGFYRLRRDGLVTDSSPMSRLLVRPSIWTDSSRTASSVPFSFQTTARSC